MFITFVVFCTFQSAKPFEQEWPDFSLRYGCIHETNSILVETSRKKLRRGKLWRKMTFKLVERSMICLPGLDEHNWQNKYSGGLAQIFMCSIMFPFVTCILEWIIYKGHILCSFTGQINVARQNLDLGC